MLSHHSQSMRCTPNSLVPFSTSIKSDICFRAFSVSRQSLPFGCLSPSLHWRSPNAHVRLHNCTLLQQPIVRRVCERCGYTDRRRRGKKKKGTSTRVTRRTHCTANRIEKIVFSFFFLLSPPVQCLDDPIISHTHRVIRWIRVYLLFSIRAENIVSLWLYKLGATTFSHSHSVRLFSLLLVPTNR